MVSAAAVNANRSRRRPYQVEDFLLTWDEHAPKQSMTPEQMWAAVQRIHTRMGGTTR